MKKMKNVVINFQVPESIKKMAEHKAKKEYMSLSAWLRKLIRDAK